MHKTLILKYQYQMKYQYLLENRKKYQDLFNRQDN